MQHTNFEIKAKTNKPDYIRGKLIGNGASYKGTDYQTDIYFQIPDGRLKLRKGKIENCLIHYNREDKKSPKKSTVILLESEPESALEKILMKLLKVSVVINKIREIYFLCNVNFHLDKVESLGNFIEIKATDKFDTIGENTLSKQCEDYINLLGINSKDLIKDSYSDLLLKKMFENAMDRKIPAKKI